MSESRFPTSTATGGRVALLHQPAEARIHDQLPPLFATEATQRISFGFSRVGGRWWSTQGPGVVDLRVCDLR